MKNTVCKSTHYELYFRADIMLRWNQLLDHHDCRWEILLTSWTVSTLCCLINPIMPITTMLWR